MVTGPEKGDEIWPRLRANLESGRLGDAVDEVDRASTKVVAHLADPHIQSLKKRGHVVGYVQSGKTANYTALGAARWPAETEHLDICPVYPDQLCLRSSQADS